MSQKICTICVLYGVKPKASSSKKCLSFYSRVILYNFCRPLKRILDGAVLTGVHILPQIMKHFPIC